MTASSTGSRALRRSLLLWPAALLTVLWAVLYLPHLRTSPGWYGDETGALLIGRNLFAGLPSVGSFWLTFWHTYYPIQPGYLWTVGFFASAFDGDIVGGRLLNTLLALAIALSICFLGRPKLGVFPAAFGAALFLTFGQSIIHFRWIYPHNAVALGFAVALLFLLRPNRPRNDWLAGLGLALATVSHPLFVHGAFAAGLCRIKRPGSWLRLGLPAGVALSVTLLLVHRACHPENWLLSDIAELAAFYRSTPAEAPAGAFFFKNFSRFYTQDAFHFGSLVCLVLCLRRRSYPIAIFGFTVSFLLLQNRQNLPVFYHQAIVLVPIFALAWAATVSTAGRVLRRHLRPRRPDRILRCAVFLLPLAFAVTLLPAVFQGRLISRNDRWVTQDTAEVESAAAWLNENTAPDELVVANTNIAWLLRARTVDHFQVVLWQGLPTTYFPNGADRSRFRFPVELSGAKFLVVGDIDRRWTLAQPGMDPLLRQLVGEKWQIAWRQPHYMILRNPRFAPEAPGSR
jgi:4-amino-4-deoxy-L-arabinose transferase-like glycosyltransferase